MNNLKEMQEKLGISSEIFQKQYDKIPQWVRDCSLIINAFSRQDVYNLNHQSLVLRNMHYGKHNDYRFAIYKKASTFCVTYDCEVFYDDHDSHIFFVLNEYQSLNAAKLELKSIVTKHILPEVKALQQIKNEKITDIKGMECKTQVGFKWKWEMVNGLHKRVISDPQNVRIGDYVVHKDRQRKFAGWVFQIEQEDLNRDSVFRIRPVFCGLKQIDFNAHRRCVESFEIEKVDIVELGRAFQNLKLVIDDIVKTKSGHF